MQKNKKGFSLIELMLVFTITVILGITAFVTFQKVSINMNVKKDIEAIKYTQSVTRTAFKSFPSYYMSNDVHIMNFLQVAGFFKDNEVTSEGYTRNHYGDIHQISPSSMSNMETGGNYGLTFEITYDGVPQAECIMLAKKLKESDFFMLSIAPGGDSSIIIYKGKGYDPAVVFSEDKIISACSGKTNRFFLVSY